MKAEVLAVGTELLLGQIPNTNAQTISQKLSEIGVDVMFHSVVGDNEARIADSISAGLSRCEVVLITGGIGPTHDDLTREAIASATGRPLERRADLEAHLREWFASLGRQMAEANLRQADQPTGAEAIPNPRGTAPGVFLEHEGGLIFAMPGVPAEMQGMMDDFVIPQLRSRLGSSVVYSRLLNVAGVPESDIAARLRPLVNDLDVSGPVTLALLASHGEVRIRLTVKSEDDAQARGAIDPVEGRARELLGAAVYGVDDDTLEGTVGEMLRTRGFTLAVAESITGGMLASRLIAVPGASDFFNAGYVAYSIESKVNDLGVPRRLLEEKGAVSEEAVIAMAEGARQKAGADVGLSTSGEAGPEPAEREVGEVFVGLAWEGGSAHRQFKAPTLDREIVRRWSTQRALNLLRLWLLGEKV